LGLIMVKAFIDFREHPLGDDKENHAKETYNNRNLRRDAMRGWSRPLCQRFYTSQPCYR